MLVKIALDKKEIYDQIPEWTKSRSQRNKKSYC